jgi:hypothetical protein
VSRVEPTSSKGLQVAGKATGRVVPRADPTVIVVRVTAPESYLLSSFVAW